MKKSVLLVVLALSLVVAACAPAPAPTPEVIVETVEVPVVETVEVPVEVVVTPTPEPTPVPPPAKVKIGALYCLTGALAEFGEQFVLAQEVAQAHFAEAGFPLEVIVADTETAAIPGVEAARMLVDVEGVHALVGAAASGVTMPIAESVSIPSEMVQISYASTNPLMTVFPADEGKDFLFRTCPSDALQGVVLGKLAYDLGYKTASVLWVNNPYGEGLMENFADAFEFRGGTVTASVPHDEAVAPTYVSELRAVMEGTPDVMIALSYIGHATVYLKEFIEAGYNATTDLLFVDGTKSVEMPPEIGPEYVAGMYGTAPGSAKGTSYDIFVAEYMRMHGRLVTLPFVTNTYDAFAVIGLAAAKCEADGVDITPICIRDNLREVANPPGEVITAGAESLKKALDLLAAGEDIDYDGAAGACDFDEVGDVVTPIEIWKYIDTPPYVATDSMVMSIPER